MKRAMLLSLIIFLITVTSTLSSELPLEGGYFKWLLHLGQSPSDRIHNAYGHGSIDGNPNLRPTPGQIMDFGDERYVGQGHPATHDMMIWTPQYSTTGYFADEGYDEWFTQYYHIYIHSPSERLARLRFRKYETLIIRNNGEQICDVRGFDWDQERFADFTLCAGVNSMTFKLMGPPDGSSERSHLAVRITDHNDAEFSDLTYSLEPPLPDADVRVSRTLPSEYDPGSSLDVTLKVDVKAYVEPNELTIIEYIPERVTVLDANGGRIVHNTLWWTLSEDMGGSTELHYTLAVPPDYAGVMPFIGYLFYDKTFVDILGDKVLFENQPISPADVPDGIETIEIYPEDYTQAKDVTVGGTSAHDYSGSLEDFAGGLVTGLKPYQTGGWAEYEFSVPYEGEYQIVLDYGELWTMFHHAADVNVVIDGELHLHTQLYPTTHCYGCCYTTSPVSWPPFDPERKAKWTIDIVKLSEGQHLLRVVFPAMYPAEQKLDRFTDGRPVLTRIILINYPGLILTDIAEPHHLDSYEHAPARLVHDRAVVQLPDGRVEMTFYGAFYSLSQGNELYFADTSVHPRSGESDAKFEVVAIEPKVFHLPPQGEQDFSLVVRSKEPVAEDYSEMVVVWLQGVPSSPSRKPYLFTTARRFVDLLPYEPQPFSWRSGPLLGFGYYGMGNDLLSGDIQDPADSFIPDRHDLGLSMGRYRCDVAQFFEQQVWTGRLPSAAEVIEKSGGVIGQSPSTWGQFWSAFLARTYWRDNTEQAKEFVQRLSENLVFYPVTRRWDWARPEYLPQFMHTDFVRGMAALQPHVRTAQEGMVSDTEQFKILHNMVLPIFNSYWDELRTIAVLTEDANEGDTTLCVDRPAYGQTGCPTDGFNMFIPAYVRIEGEPYPLRYSTGSNVMELTRPLSRAYSKGTRITSWAFIEEIELEAREVCSLAVIAAASRDPAVIDQSLHMLGEIFDKQYIFLDDGSFKNEPGSYGGIFPYAEVFVVIERLLGEQWLDVVSASTMDKIHKAIINISQFPFSNGHIPHLNGGGCLNQLGRDYFKEIYMLEELFPDDQEHIELYKRIEQQENNRVPGDIIDNHNFVVHGWGYAMLRAEDAPWDRRMETLLSSKHLMSDPGDHVSHDGLGIVVYGLGAILTPRYGYSWIARVPPFLNQVMMDEDYSENMYYGSFWHFDGRSELPSAVAHTGDGDDCSELPSERSRWCIQFPEYLFDAYLIASKDGLPRQYDWCLFNMGELTVVEPALLSWQDCSDFMSSYWDGGSYGGGPRAIASKQAGKVIADWAISNGPWELGGDPRLLRFPAAHSGRLRLIMADSGPSSLINAQIGPYVEWTGDQAQANSQDILVVRKPNVASHAFVDTLEPIADYEQAYVEDVTVVARGNHNQQLVRVTTAEGEDWIYLSGKWGSRSDGDQPIADIYTDADILAWRVVCNKVTRFYLAGGSYADIPNGSWDFGSHGNHYVADNDGG